MVIEGTNINYSNPFLILFQTVLLRCAVCVAVPHLPRPSDEEFIHYAKEGKTEQVREALQYYPDLISIRDNTVGAL